MRRTTVLKLVITEDNPSFSTLQEKSEHEIKDRLLTLLMFPTRSSELDVEVLSVRDMPVPPKYTTSEEAVDNSKDL